MSDLIKRTDAIKAVLGITMYEALVPIDTVIYNIKSVPSADRPQGEWYQIEDHKVMGEGYMWHCSLCGHRVYQDGSADYPTENFCPHCGARMKGADDEKSV